MLSCLWLLGAVALVSPVLLCPQTAALALVLYIYSLWRRVSAIPEASLDAAAASFPHKRVLAELSTTAVQCSFCAGNVFFEVLFCDLGRCVLLWSALPSTESVTFFRTAGISA